MSTPTLGILTDEQAYLLTNEIFEFNQSWYEGEELGTCDSMGGSEWRNALVRLLALPGDARTAWLAQPAAVRAQNPHLLTRGDIWDVWNALDEDNPSPVKTIARKLDTDPAVVAAVVFPAPDFGWEPDDEPDLPDTTNPTEETTA